MRVQGLRVLLSPLIVRQRERERERQTDRQTDREKLSEGGREGGRRRHIGEAEDSGLRTYRALKAWASWIGHSGQSLRNICVRVCWV